MELITNIPLRTWAQLSIKIADLFETALLNQR